MSEEDKIITKFADAWKKLNNQSDWFSAKRLPFFVKAVKMDNSFKVQTLEGTMSGEAGDYLIEGIEKEVYPVKASIFLKSYRRLT